MAFANIFIRTSRDSCMGWAISAASLTLLLLFGMSVYRDIDLTVYNELPEAFRSLLSIGEDVDVRGLAIGYIFGSLVALVLTAMALVMGSAAIAGELRNGTMGILLVNPKSRTHVLLSKAVALALLTGATFFVLWAPIHPIAATAGRGNWRPARRGSGLSSVRQRTVLPDAGAGHRRRYR